MATITLSDGRELPVVKPHIGDQMELERQMKAANPKYGPAQFREDLDLSGFQTAFAVFASLNRGGVPTTIHEVLELDLGALAELVTLDPGEGGTPAPAEKEVEDEQTPDPQLAPTGDSVNP
jgi:hypothetical protein